MARRGACNRARRGGPSRGDGRRGSASECRDAGLGDGEVFLVGGARHADRSDQRRVLAQRQRAVRSYFPYNAKLCINGHEYLKRQLAKRGVAFEALDNGIASCADPALG